MTAPTVRDTFSVAKSTKEGGRTSRRGHLFEGGVGERVVRDASLPAESYRAEDASVISNHSHKKHKLNKLEA